MDKGWFRLILTWVVIIPDLVMSYHAMRNLFYNIEVTSLALNFIATTVLFYVYMDIGKDQTESEEEGEESGQGRSLPESSPAPSSGVCNLVFSSLIEDMLVWTGLFFLLYNIVPLALLVHNFAARNI